MKKKQQNTQSLRISGNINFHINYQLIITSYYTFNTYRMFMLWHSKVQFLLKAKFAKCDSVYYSSFEYQKV